MSAHKPTWVTSWEAKRNVGARRYILMVGLVGWGSFFLFAICIAQHGIPRSWSMAVIYVVVSALGGLGAGAGTWYRTERRYKKYVAATTMTPSSIHAA